MELGKVGNEDIFGEFLFFQVYKVVEGFAFGICVRLRGYLSRKGLWNRVCRLVRVKHCPNKKKIVKHCQEFPFDLVALLGANG